MSKLMRPLNLSAETVEVLRRDFRRYQEEAREECRRCDGRAQGDCSDQCLMFAMTASNAEIEEAARRNADYTGSTLPIESVAELGSTGTCCR